MGWIGSFCLSIFISSCDTNNTSLLPSNAINQATKDALNATIQDEYKAQAIYERVLTDFGASTIPFKNIIRAEEKHAQSLANVMDNYAMDVPQNNFKITDFPSFATVKEACAAGLLPKLKTSKCTTNT